MSKCVLIIFKKLLTPFNSVIFAHSYSGFVSIIVFVRIFANGMDIFRMYFSDYYGGEIAF